jgi:sulfoxide reductase heme-binding subunit YedZ
MQEWTFVRITDGKPHFNYHRTFKPIVFITCLLPMSLLAWATINGRLSANPLEDIRDTTGLWTLRFLMVTLTITPVRKITGWHEPIRFRRMLGLFAFFHAILHFVTYVWLDQFFDFSEMVADLTKRRFIMAGYASFILLIPLAITSTKKWIGRLGGKRWQLLHRLVYVSAAAGVIHYLWRVKLDVQRPILYGLVLTLFLALRLRRKRRLQHVNSGTG